MDRIKLHKLFINKNKFDLFLEIAKELNKIDIVSILHGSLGLNLCIGEFCNSEDIDVLVPKEYVNINNDHKWDFFKEFMESLGFKLKDLHEHEFVKNKIVINFFYNDLKDFADIDSDELIELNINDAKFKILSPEQFLRIYSVSRRDDYRIEKLGKQDQEKIDKIKEYLNKRCL